MTFRPEDETRGEASGGPLGEEFPTRKSPTEEGRRRRLGGRPGLVPLVVGFLLLALVIGAVLLWRSYGDRAGGTSVFEDSVESGPEPTVRLTNGPGQVNIQGVKGQENVEVSAKRYARGFNPTSAKNNAASVPVNIDHEDSTVEISTDGGRGTGADYDLKVPPGSVVEIESAVGDVKVSGLTNDATIRAEGGDVTVKDVQGSVTIEAPQGDVTVERVSTETGNAQITVGSGDVTLKDLVVGILESRVEAGDVTLSGRFSGSGRILVETGSIDVQLPPEDDKDLVLEARVGEVVRQGEQESK